MEARLPSPDSYRELAKWLLVLADYALTLSRRPEGPAGLSVEEPGSPDSWREAGTTGPPAHWLALLKQEDALEWQNSQDFAQPVQGIEPFQAPGPERIERLPPQPVPTSAGPGEPPGGEPRPPVQPIIETRPEPPEAREQAAPGAAQPAAPAGPPPTRTVTRLRLRPSPKAVASVRNPVGRAPIEEAADDAGQELPANEPPFRKPQIRDAAAHLPEAGRADNPSVQGAPELSVSPQSASRPTRLRLQPARDRAKTPLSRAQLERRKIRLRPPAGRVTAGNLPLTRPVLIPAVTTSVEPAPPGPRLPQTPVERALPPSKPRRQPVTTYGRWPKLPRRAPPPVETAEEAYEKDHQQRLDEEQKGRPWNA